MKKIVLLICFISLSACSKDDDTNNNRSRISPPDWIIGTWLADGGNGEAMNVGFRFTNDDVILISTSMELSSKGQVETWIQTEVDVSVEESETDEFYELRINHPYGQTMVYSFSKLDNISISWKNASVIELPLYRQ